MRLNYNDMLLLAIWEYNRRQDEDLTLELFQETFGQVPGAHSPDRLNAIHKTGGEQDEYKDTI